jgi:hypothetical protein
MVERAKEGMTAPIPETEFHVLNTTLAELGVDTSFDNLNLAGDRFTLGVKKVGEDTIFFGLLHHPLAGGHFAQFLNSVSPSGDLDIGNIIADVDLPIRAQADYQKGQDRTTSEPIRLHERHLKDSRVGPPYIRFAEDHVSSWLRALQNTSSRDAFWVLGNVKFITNLKTFTDEYFSKVEEELTEREQESSQLSYRINYTNGLLNIGWKLLDKGSNWGCGDFKSLFYDMRGLGEIEDRGKLFTEYQKLSIGEGVELIRTFFERNPNSKQGFVLNYFFAPKEVLVDLKNGCLRGGSPDPNLQTRLVDAETLEISDREGTRFLVAPNKNAVIPGGFGWKIKDAEFSDRHLSSKGYPPLYPVIAWRNKNGAREFLTQQEAMPLVRELGLSEGEQGDTKLGEIGVASFARDIIKGWEPKMTLKRLPGPQSRFIRDEQEMRGAQMPAWVGIERHKDELLNSKISPLAIMERGSGFVA